MGLIEGKIARPGRNGGGEDQAHGIIITGEWRGAAPSLPGEASPRIAAFIWGWKVRPAPTLPFGRWKNVA